MSADSPRRGGLHRGTSAAQVVIPQPVSDKSIIDSVAGIINDIVPQAYTGGVPNSDNRETITWARFEYADVNDPAFFSEYSQGSNIPPLLLVLGYSTGMQVWLIAASGEASEVLSWRQGMVRTARILPNPKRGEKENQRDDPYRAKRPMIAICDSAGPGPQFCSVSFLSLKTGEQVKSIKFKTSVCDVLANKRSIVVTFPERIAVFDAVTLEDMLTITTCYLSPGPNPNPVALGSRWLAYSEKKLIPGRRSSGGSEGEGVASYTATVLYAAKSLGKGLRGLGETVASSLTGNSVSPVTSANNVNSADSSQPGIVTVLDLLAAKEEKNTDDTNLETVVAHFAAHSDAIVAMTFDQTGALLMTADKRGHDFHVFRIQPHPGGPNLAAVHHLYVLHRGDTTAKVQDMTFSSDARWAAVSTVRGTTHVFPVAPYGGSVGVRTHSSPHVVNRLSRFHRSAGLTDDGARSHSPVSHSEMPLSVYPYTNPRLPPYPHPTIIHPLAQIRQPSSLNHSSSQAQPRVQQRQRLQSDDSVTLPLKICACFAPPRAWIYAQHDSTNRLLKRAVDSLFIMACHGNMIQYDLEPKPSSGVPKEKVCDTTAIELEVEPKGQWPLQRTTSSADIVPPLPSTSPLLGGTVAPANDQEQTNNESRWLSQVEIITHNGPHRRLWMGPQFVFKTYNAPSGVAANLVEAETVEIGTATGSRPARSNPVNMPHSASRPLVPVVIDGSGSSYEQSPRFVETYGDALDHESVIGGGENQLREDLAEAMLETSSTPHRATGRRMVVERVGHPVAKVVNPLGTVITISADEEDAISFSQQDYEEDCCASTTTTCSSSSNNPSICAEEGKLGSDGKELEAGGRELRDHTEICAEMRSANEPAVIDSVPPDSIEELKERRTLCAEAATTSTNCAKVDLDRIGAFKDVPSSPSLCAEKGAVPDCSNVIQGPMPGKIRCVVGILEEEDTKPALEKELGFQLIESQERASVLISPDNFTTKVNTSSSDDDIVHINKEELPVVTQSKKKQSPSSDDDIEHVLHSDISEAETQKSSTTAVPSASSSGSGSGSSISGRKRSKDKRVVIPPTVETIFDASKDNVKLVKEIENPTPKHSELKQQQEQQQPSQNYSKKTRIRSKRQSATNSSNDMVEIINMDLPTPVLSPPPPTPPESPPPTPPQTPPPIAQQSMSSEKFDEPSDMVEIINIDAEKNSGCFLVSPLSDCQIILPKPEPTKKRNKRQKQQQQQQQKISGPISSPRQKTCDIAKTESPEKEISQDSSNSSPNAWITKSKSRSNSVIKSEDMESIVQQPIFEIECDKEANKENVDISKPTQDEILNILPKSEIIEEAMEDIVTFEKPVMHEEPMEDIFIPSEKSLPVEELEKKQSEPEQSDSRVSVERSSSLDDMCVPMDTKEQEEENSNSNIREQRELSTHSDKSTAPGDINIVLPTSTALPIKKNNRSKKKKRR